MGNDRALRQAIQRKLDTTVRRLNRTRLQRNALSVLEDTLEARIEALQTTLAALPEPEQPWKRDERHEPETP